MLVAGLTPRKQILQTALSGFLRYVLFFLYEGIGGGEGCGGGTKVVGFCTLRPDFVVVGAYVSLSEVSPPASSSSARFRLPPRPPRLPLVVPLVGPRARLPLGLPGGRPRVADEGVTSVMAVGVSSPTIGKLTRLLLRLPRADTEPPRVGVETFAGCGVAIAS